MKKQYADDIENAFIDADGIYRWCSSGRVPFDDMLESWELPKSIIAKCQAARDIDDSNFLREYRKRMENYEPSGEELFEMRAAFGEGEVVVNVITGKKIQL